MAVYRIFPEKDTFIFSEASSSNAGLDEIVELGGYYDVTGTGETSRILVQFSSTEIADIVSNKIVDAFYKYIKEEEEVYAGEQLICRSL